MNDDTQKNGLGHWKNAFHHGWFSVRYRLVYMDINPPAWLIRDIVHAADGGCCCQRLSFVYGIFCLSCFFFWLTEMCRGKKHNFGTPQTDPPPATWTDSPCYRTCFPFCSNSIYTPNYMHIRRNGSVYTLGIMPSDGRRWSGTHFRIVESKNYGNVHQ